MKHLLTLLLATALLSCEKQTSNFDCNSQPLTPNNFVIEEWEVVPHKIDPVTFEVVDTFYTIEVRTHATDYRDCDQSIHNYTYKGLETEYYTLDTFYFYTDTATHERRRFQFRLTF
jgi:hypothetical protein